MKTKQIMASLGLVTIATTGLTVSAEETTVTQPVPTTETVQSQLVTEQEVTQAKTELDKATEDLKNQETAVANDTEADKQAQAEVNTAKGQVASAEELLKKATEAEVESATAKVAETENNIKAAEQSLTEAKSNKEVAQGKVAAQETQVQAAQDVVAAKQAEVKTAQTEVEQAQAILDGTDAANIIKAADEAQANLTVAQEALPKAQQALAEAQQADAARAQAITQAQADLATAQTNQSTAQTASEQANQIAEETAQRLAGAQASFTQAENDKNSINTITLTADYIRDLKEYTEKDRTGEDRTDVMNRLRAMANSLKEANQFVPNPNDDNTTSYPVNDIPTEVLTEVSLFASDLINQVRTQVGAPALTTVTPSSVAFADLVTDNAVAANWDSWKQGHNKAGITAVAQFYQLKGSQNVANYYENWAGSSTFAQTNVTLAQLKRHVHYSILMFLFSEREWDHANSIAGLRYSGSPTVGYLSVDMTNVGGYSGLHFLEINDTDLTPASTNFDTTAIANPKSSVAILQAYNDAQVALTEAQAANQTAQADKTTRQANLDTANAAVASAQDTLRTAQAVLERTPTAQTLFEQAQARVTAAEAVHAKAQEALRNLNADVQTKQANLQNAKANLAQKEEALRQAQTALTTEQTTLRNLQVALESAQAALAKAEDALRQKEVEHQAAQDYLNSLRQAPQLLAIAKDKLQVAQAKQTKTGESLAQANLILAKLQETYAKATEKYTTLNSRYQDQLEKERQAKLKAEHDAIVKRGEQPLPVLDTKGQLIGYTTAPKAQQAGTTTRSTVAAASPIKTLPKTGTTEAGFPILLGLFLSGLGMFGLRRKQN